VNYDKSYFGTRGGRASDIQLRDTAQSIVDNFHPSTVLDIGCGQAYLVHHLYQLGVEAYGVDISTYAISTAPADVSSHLLKIDLEVDNLPFVSGSMDLITALNILEHVKNLDHVIEEMGRVLRVGGSVFMISPLPITNSKLGQFLLGRGWHLLDTTHVNVHSRSFWEQIFAKHGFAYRGSFDLYSRAVPPIYWITKILVKLPLCAVFTSHVRGWYLFQKTKG